MSIFDVPIERRGTDSFKWDDTGRIFGSSELMPFWVADMDFATPQPILDAIRERTRHPVFGYGIRPQDYSDAILGWLERRHGWRVPPEWLMFCPPGTIVAMHGLIHALTKPGDSILVPTPNYGPLLNLVSDNDRHLLHAPLHERDGRFELRVQDLERALDDHTRVLIISSPHNPTGRVFTREELVGVAEFAAHHELFVISDEVHCDLAMPGHTHLPYGSIDERNSVTLISPNKTFNTAGLPQSTAIIPEPTMRAFFRDFLDTTQLNHDTAFGSVAMIAAYRHCGDWLDELIPYLDANHRFVADYLEAKVPGVRKVPAEGTYLAWFDCRGLGLDEAEIMRRLVDIGGVGLYAGSEFGPDSEGYFRMNLACARETLHRGMDRIRRALAN